MNSLIPIVLNVYSIFWVALQGSEGAGVVAGGQNADVARMLIKYVTYETKKGIAGDRVL